MLWINQQASSLVTSNTSVPLKEIHVDVHLRSFAADVTLTQVFQNDESVPIEAVYCFPVEDNAAIYSFIARIDDEREIVAELKEKKIAQQEYTQAIAQGHGAYLFEQDENSNDIFVVSVGALKPDSKCSITISYVSELDLLYGSKKPTIRFVVPTTIAPRYSPAQKGISSPGGTQVKYAESVPYTIEFSCQVDKLDQHVACVSSPSHPIKIDTSNEETFLVTFSQEGIQLDRDIIIDVELSQIRKNTIAAIEKGALMISFMPDDQDCRQNSSNVTDEFLFVIDCSGSMESDDKIGLARKAMFLFIKSLPVDCRFNIIRFGSSFSALFSDQVTCEYNEKNMRQAESLIKSMGASMGGTELLKPLSWLMESKPPEGCVRQIFLMTDGEVSNVDQVTDLCRKMSEFARIFSFGLGQSPSRALVKGLARATNGHFTFIAPNTNVDIHVAEQLARALHPNIKDVTVKWKTSQEILYSVPEHAPPVFVGDRQLFYALLDESTPFDHTTTVELITGKQQQLLGVARVDHTPSTLSPQTITRLAAKVLLRELLHAPQTTPKERLVDLSIKYGILCPYTAFIGVEKRLDADVDSNANMELREVPIMLGPSSPYQRFASLASRYSGASNASSARLQSMQNDVNAVCVVLQDNLARVLQRDCQLSSLGARDATLDYSEAKLRRASGPRTIRSTSVGSILQSGFGFVSSLFTRKSVAPPINAVWATDEQSQQDLEVDWPVDEQKLIDRFIERQQYDGLWMLTKDDVKQLTGKSLTDFSSSVFDMDEKHNQELLTTTALAIVILEARCASSKTLWQALSNKACKRLIDLLKGDQEKLEQLLRDIRDQLF